MLIFTNNSKIANKDMSNASLATENSQGVSRIATQSETNTGTVNNAFVTPATLRNILTSIVEPIGQVNFFYANTVPDNYLIMDGSHWSKTTYSELFAKIGSLPNVSSDTLEFWIESSESRFTRATSLTNQVGSVQEDAIRNITGSGVAMMQNGGTGSPNGVFISELSGLAAQGAHGSSATLITGFDASLEVPTANENRPKDFALLQCIKYTLGF